jgi:hypothetical protein
MFSSSVEEVYGVMVDLLYDMGRYDDGFDYLERAKARAFLDMLGGRSVKAKKSVDPALIKKEKDVQKRIETVAVSLRSARGQEARKKYKAYKKLIDERMSILEEIKRQSLEYAATTSVATVPVKDIASRIGKSAALLSYFVGDERTIIWIVKEGKVHALSSDIGSEKLSDLIADYRGAIVSRQEEHRVEVGKELFNRLIKTATVFSRRATLTGAKRKPTSSSPNRR